MKMNQKVEQILSEVKASLSFEGLQITEEEEKLIKAALMGDISRSAFLKKARELAENQ
ncbi:hypothetical protein MKY25_13605 [Geobacillus sp. FSL W8-0032]|uniref:Antitoxin VbhA domain-containing protein n=2 Tax=Geobacillus TaxID=129337 RepID=A0A679FM50_9BACL|nr:MULTISPECIES: hypothetical protein [Geobacillus]KYD24425.1 hypothetical protein B4113_2460 [Geobacillus sp. B4113_201601]MEB3749246.1 hypothetical protein [Geobacillus icigianus]BBW97030.1 hypothetical protein GsuE55_18630 [Geobacillus subterraneus]